MKNVAGTSTRKSPKQFLQEIVDDITLPKNVRADAAKSLLPYTAKKTAETLETRNFSYSLDMEALKGLSDDELSTLLVLLRKVAIPGDVGEGNPETEVPDDN